MGCVHVQNGCVQQPLTCAKMMERACRPFPSSCGVCKNDGKGVCRHFPNNCRRVQKGGADGTYTAALGKPATSKEPKEEETCGLAAQ